MRFESAQHSQRFVSAIGQGLAGLIPESSTSHSPSGGGGVLASCCPRREDLELRLLLLDARLLAQDLAALLAPLGLDLRHQRRLLRVGLLLVRHDRRDLRVRLGEDLGPQRLERSV